MSESKEWRRTVLICVFALCISAIICCWIHRPLRYQMLDNANSATRLLDTQSGDIVMPKWKTNGK
jgi:hypothetical protein